MLILYSKTQVAISVPTKVRSSFFSRVLSHVPYLGDLDRNQIEKYLQLDHVEPLLLKDVTPLHFQQYNPLVTHPVDNRLSPILMLHGLFGSSRNFRSVGKKITERTRHFAGGVDLRNHGKTANVAPIDYLSMVRDVINSLEVRQWKDTILAGHSMGAKVAMLVALLRPDLVSKLVVIDNSPVSQPLEKNFTLDLLGMCLVERTFSSYYKEPISPLRTSYIDKELSKYEKDRKVRFFLTSNIEKRATKRSTLFDVPVLNLLKDDVITEIGDWPLGAVIGKTFSKPVLIMEATGSNFINEESISSFNEFFPNNRKTTFKSGHWIVSEMPHKFIEEFIDFIKL
ncbi:uncharacterized protein PRCAT00001245001 [Priceomyces carsonii]|uniref:uncharacterized protein n=1 Tax=Priceomyces carsonii TaxID=28549 RepID=UPI002ED9BC81|nr:unnamed protein product [Priceomyces carsonii]